MMLPYERPTEPGPLGKLVALLAGMILLVAAFMFSVVILAIVSVVGLAAWGYFWWKTRALRRAMRENTSANGQVIDGEAVVVDDSRTTRIVDVIESHDK